MFFKELYGVAKHTPFTMIITPQGERLSVIIQPRPTGDAEDRKGLAAPIKAIGTPAELDAELPAKLAEYASRVNDVRTSIDLPLDAVDQEKGKASKKAARAKKRAKAKADKKAGLEKKRKEAAERKAKRRAEEEAKKKAAAEKRARTLAAKKSAKSKLPGATAPAPKAAAGKGDKKAEWPFPTGSKAPEGTISAPADKTDGSHRAGLPGKEECLADYRNLKRVHGDKLSFRVFKDNAATGRRFEKLWPAPHWANFVKAAEKAGNDPGVDLAKDPGAPKRTIPIAKAEDAPPPARKLDCGGCKNLVYSAPGGQAHNRAPHARCRHFNADIRMLVTKEGSVIECLIPAGCPTFPDAPVRQKGYATDKHTDVFDEAGNYLSSITTAPEVGKHIGLMGHPKLLRITAIDVRMSGGMDVTVVPDPEYTAKHAQEIADAVRTAETTKESGAAPTTAAKAAPPSSASEPDARPAPAAAKAVAPDPKPFKVLDGAGKILVQSKHPYAVNERLEVPGREGRFKVTRQHDDNPHLFDAAPVPHWTVFNPAGEEIGSIDAEPTVGAKVDVGEYTGLTVIEVDGQECTAAAVKPRQKSAAATATTE